MSIWLLAEPRAPFTLASGSTHSTRPRTVGPFVGIRERVPRDAFISEVTLEVRGGAAKVVDTLSHVLQMFWVAAQSVPAEVIEGRSDRAYKLFVDESVDEHYAASVVCLAVPPSGCTGPLPATRLSADNALEHAFKTLLSGQWLRATAYCHEGEVTP